MLPAQPCPAVLGVGLLPDRPLLTVRGRWGTDKLIWLLARRQSRQSPCPPRELHLHGFDGGTAQHAEALVSDRLFTGHCRDPVQGLLRRGRRAPGRPGSGRSSPRSRQPPAQLLRGTAARQADAGLRRRCRSHWRRRGEVSVLRRSGHRRRSCGTGRQPAANTAAANTAAVGRPTGTQGRSPSRRAKPLTSQCSSTRDCGTQRSTATFWGCGPKTSGSPSGPIRGEDPHR